MDGVNYFLDKNFKNYTMAGRPRARTQIVPPQDVLDKQTIHTEKWLFMALVAHWQIPIASLNG